VGESGKPTRQLSLQPVAAEARVEEMKRSKPSVLRPGSTRVGVMAGGHLDCRVPELGAASEDAVLLDDGVTEKLSQFVNFLSG